MKAFDQRAAIFGACGFTDEIVPGIGNGWYRRNPATGETRRIPEYLTDLNAMHEAERIVWTDTYRYVYNHWLDRVVGATPVITGIYESSLARRASAAQRAEAFLRTLNLWIEDGS